MERGLARERVRWEFAEERAVERAEGLGGWLRHFRCLFSDLFLVAVVVLCCVVLRSWRGRVKVLRLVRILFAIYDSELRLQMREIDRSMRNVRL